MIRVLVADDHTLVRQSLVSVLAASGACEVVGEASNGLEAVEQALRLRPDVAIVDISMPGLNGIEVVRRLHAELPATRTLVLTMHEEDEYVLHVVRAGAAGYLLKDSAVSELLHAVKQVHGGHRHFGPNAARVLAEAIARPQAEPADPYGRLTSREREIFHLVAEGATSKEVARRLEISVKTAENHRASILDKLGLKNTAELVRYAVRKGLLD